MARKLPTWDVRPTVAIGVKTDEMCLGRVLLGLTDAVEKVLVDIGES
jgi:hypothetical protein